ncbi:MAG: DUF1993 domain-containing protein [Pseudomonadota bacterium]
MSQALSFILKSSVQQTIGAMTSILKKAEAHGHATGVEDSVFLAARLYPDMHPLIKQIQMSNDIALRGSARLAGVEPATVEDNEQSFADCIARCQNTLAGVEALDAAAIDANEMETLQIPIGEMTMPMEGRFYLSNFLLPNLHFHASTTYGLLRMQGLAVGKRDFLMPG